MSLPTGRPDVLAAVADLPRGARPSKYSVQNIDAAVTAAFGGDEAVRAIVQGNIKPSITWVLGSRTLIRLEENWTKWSYVTLAVSDIGTIAVQSTLRSWELFLFAADGSGWLDTISTPSEQAAFQFAAAHRYITRQQLCDLAMGVEIDCEVPYSFLSGSSAASELVNGNLYNVGFSHTGVVVSDVVGPLMMFPEAQVTDLSISGPEQVYAVEEIETRVLLSTTEASISLINPNVLPQELHAHLLPQLQRITRRNACAMGPPTGSSLADELGKLAELRAAGHLEPEEYAAAKRRLLGQAS